MTSIKVRISSSACQILVTALFPVFKETRYRNHESVAKPSVMRYLVKRVLVTTARSRAAYMSEALKVWS